MAVAAILVKENWVAQFAAINAEIAKGGPKAVGLTTKRDTEMTVAKNKATAKWTGPEMEAALEAANNVPTSFAAKFVFADKALQALGHAERVANSLAAKLDDKGNFKDPKDWVRVFANWLSRYSYDSGNTIPRSVQENIYLMLTKDPKTDYGFAALFRDVVTYGLTHVGEIRFSLGGMAHGKQKRCHSYRMGSRSIICTLIHSVDRNT